MLGVFSKLAPGRAASYVVKNADRFSGRYLEYSVRMLRERGRFDRFHVADHSYAHLALVLPAGRIGVYCHDTDAFLPLFEPNASAWRRSLARLLLAGMRRADIVFYSTGSVRESIVRHSLVPEHLLVHAPYGVAREFQPGPTEEDARLDGRRPFVLHVGSLIPRKNPEFLLRLVASVRAQRPDIELVQVGGTFSNAHERLLDELGLRAHLRRLSGLSRGELAALYRRARAVLQPSTAEGFGLPIIEALSCGAPVVASDLPVLREVGGNATDFCPVNELDTWRSTLLGVLDEAPGARAEPRLRWAATFSWHAHARTIVDGHARVRTA
jgi:glycosyltransferase involved in cell wall biosynthesis